MLRTAVDGSIGLTYEVLSKKRVNKLMGKLLNYHLAMVCCRMIQGILLLLLYHCRVPRKCRAIPFSIS